jgi:hypothetical protein
MGTASILTISLEVATATRFLEQEVCIAGGSPSWGGGALDGHMMEVLDLAQIHSEPLHVPSVRDKLNQSRCLLHNSRLDYES